LAPQHLDQVLGSQDKAIKAQLTYLMSISKSYGQKMKYKLSTKLQEEQDQGNKWQELKKDGRELLN
jgi:hypothetical protein